MRNLSLSAFALVSALATSATAAPSADNTVQAILEKSCQAGACVEGYSVKFKQVSYENAKQVTTLFVTLLPIQSITYPIIEDRFEAQLTQTSFAGVCRVKGVARESFDALSRGEEGAGIEEFHVGLKSCLSSLSARTELALGR